MAERASMIDGTAFLDGLSSLGTLGNLVIVTDGTGKTAIGYIKSLGTGETVGAALITGTDSDMSGPNNWIDGGLAAFDVNVTVANRMFMTGNGGGDLSQHPNVGSLGMLIKASLKAELLVGAEQEIHYGAVVFGAGINNYIAFTPTATEQTFSGYFNSAISKNREIGMPSPGFNAKSYSFGDVLDNQVLTPSTNGLVIENAAVSGVENWASIESGFDPNDIANVQIIGHKINPLTTYLPRLRARGRLSR